MNSRSGEFPLNENLGSLTGDGGIPRPCSELMPRPITCNCSRRRPKSDAKYKVKSVIPRTMNRKTQTALNNYRYLQLPKSPRSATRGWLVGQLFVITQLKTDFWHNTYNPLGCRGLSHKGRYPDRIKTFYCQLLDLTVRELII